MNEGSNWKRERQQDAGLRLLHPRSALYFGELQGEKGELERRDGKKKKEGMEREWVLERGSWSACLVTVSC